MARGGADSGCPARAGHGRAAGVRAGRGAVRGRETMIRRLPMRRWLGIALIVAVSAGLFWVTFRIVDLSALDAAMKNAARQRELVP
jgi:hypothetical protein